MFLFFFKDNQLKWHYLTDIYRHLCYNFRCQKSTSNSKLEDIVCPHDFPDVHVVPLVFQLKLSLNILNHLVRLLTIKRSSSSSHVYLGNTPLCFYTVINIPPSLKWIVLPFSKQFQVNSTCFSSDAICSLKTTEMLLFCSSLSLSQVCAFEEEHCALSTQVSRQWCSYRMFLMAFVHWSRALRTQKLMANCNYESFFVIVSQVIVLLNKCAYTYLLNHI